jgi:hypothetical protein
MTLWAIRVRLQIASRCRELALFNLAIDSKLRTCDLMQLRVRDVWEIALLVKFGRPAPLTLIADFTDDADSDH